MRSQVGVGCRVQRREFGLHGLEFAGRLSQAPVVEILRPWPAADGRPGVATEEHLRCPLPCRGQHRAAYARHLVFDQSIRRIEHERPNG